MILPGFPMMMGGFSGGPISWVRNGTTSQSSTSNTPGLPSVDGAQGLLVAFLRVDNRGSGVATATAGWTLAASTKPSSDVTSQEYQTFIWTAPEGSAAPVFTWTGLANSGGIVAYFKRTAGAMSGVGSVNTYAEPYNPPNGRISGSVGSITTTQSNSSSLYLLWLGGTNTVTTPTGYTEHYNNFNLSGRISFGTQPMPAPAATGTLNSTFGGATYGYSFFNVELK